MTYIPEWSDGPSNQALRIDCVYEHKLPYSQEITRWCSKSFEVEGRRLWLLRLCSAVFSGDWMGKQHHATQSSKKVISIQQMWQQHQQCAKKKKAERVRFHISLERMSHIYRTILLPHHTLLKICCVCHETWIMALLCYTLMAWMNRIFILPIAIVSYRHT